jgi:hypothetical protein
MAICSREMHGLERCSSPGRPDDGDAAMQLKEITDCFSELKVVEKRCVTEDFVELVFSSDEVDEWHRILTAFLDQPSKPKGQEPSDKDLLLTAKTGGIRLDQTLFEKTFANGTIIAKFWPWKDNIHITLRMALLIL